MVKLRQLHTKAVCRVLRTKLNHETLKYETQECGWYPQTYIEGTTHVKCLNCGGTIEIPEEIR